MPKDTFLEFVLDQLQDLGGVHSRAMFGGHGIYFEGIFFAIVSKDRLYFKTTDATRPRYEAYDMAPFRPSATQTLTSYYEVPADVFEARELLLEWAEEAIEVARRGRSDAP